MTKVLITGATGNVGRAVIEALAKQKHTLQISAAVKNIQKDATDLPNNPLNYVAFNFTDSSTYAPALKNCDILFLLRPPQIADVKKHFKPIIDTCIVTGVKHIVFLSVQGVEKSKLIPHHKIEQLIVNSNIPYTFLRPAYFMQNFTTTLKQDLVQKRRIYLPAGKAPFTLIDVRDVGTVAAAVLMNHANHMNQAYDLTSNDRMTFAQMADALSNQLDVPIRYTSPSLLSFFLTKRKENMPVMFILVMIMLHYLPGFQQPPPLSGWVEKLTGHQPISFKQFIKDHQEELLN